MNGLLNFIKTPTAQAQDPLAAREKWLNLASIFQGMTINPQAGQQGIQQQLANIQQQREKQKSLVTQNATLDAMQKAGLDPKLIAVAKANPELYKDIAQSLIKSQIGTNYMTKYSTPLVDPETGQVYVIRTDPNTNKVTRMNIEGASAETPAAKTQRETQATLTQGDIQAGYDMGAQYFTQYETLRTKLSQYDKAIAALDRGGQSGIVRDFLPAFTEATSSLRQAANQLGITVINSATFGALSEAELKLALSTEIDLSLPPAELRTQILAKRNAQAKLAMELAKKAREAQTLGRKAFIDKYTTLQTDNPDDIGTNNEALFKQADQIIGG